MVAGGVQSVEENSRNYETEVSFYPQFYSTLLPPQPPGSYSTGSTYSSSGVSCTCPSPTLSLPLAQKHPRCTCPTPVQLIRSASQVSPQKPRHPRCTCPSPTLSGRGSPWESSPTPPLSPQLKPKCTCPKPLRHPRCTCPEPPLEKECNCPSRKSSQRLLRNKQTNRPLHATLLKCSDNTASLTTHQGNFILTPNPQFVSEFTNGGTLPRKREKRRKEKSSLRRSSQNDQTTKRNLAETTNGISVSTASLPGVPSANLSNGHPRTSMSVENLHDAKKDKVDKKIISYSSPAKKVKSKIISFKHVITSLVRSAPSSLKVKQDNGQHYRENGDEDESFYPDVESVSHCTTEEEIRQISFKPTSDSSRYQPYGEQDGTNSLFSFTGQLNKFWNLKNGSTFGVAEKILPRESRSELERTSVLKPTKSPKVICSGDTFSFADLPSPIVDDLLSPLGGVPPLSPPEMSPLPLGTPTRSNFARDMRLPQNRLRAERRSHSPSFVNNDAVHSQFAINKSPSRCVKNQERSLKYCPEKVAGEGPSPYLFRTRSLDISSDDANNFRADSKDRSKNISYVSPPGLHRDRSASLRCQKPPRVSMKSVASTRTSMRSVHRLDRSTPVSEISDRECSCRNAFRNPSVESLPTVCRGPHYENVVLSRDGKYMMLSKRLLDQWDLPDNPSPIPTISPAESMTVSESSRSVHSGEFVEGYENPFMGFEFVKRNSLDRRKFSIEVDDVSRPNPPFLSSFKPLTVLPSEKSNTSLSTLFQLATRHVGGLMYEEVPSGETSRTSILKNKDKFIKLKDDGDTDQETDRLLGQQRSDDTGFLDDKSWRRLKSRTAMPRTLPGEPKEPDSEGGGGNSNDSTPSTPGHHSSTNQMPSSPHDLVTSNKIKAKKVIRSTQPRLLLNHPMPIKE